ATGALGVSKADLCASGGPVGILVERIVPMRRVPRGRPWRRAEQLCQLLKRSAQPPHLLFTEFSASLISSGVERQRRNGLVGQGSARARFDSSSGTGSSRLDATTRQLDPHCTFRLSEIVTILVLVA